MFFFDRGSAVRKGGKAYYYCKTCDRFLFWAAKTDNHVSMKSISSYFPNPHGTPSVNGVCNVGSEREVGVFTGNVSPAVD